MILTIEILGKITLARTCISRLDIGTADGFRKELALLEPAQNVVLDLGSVEFIDSTGLGALLSLLRKLKLNGGDLRLTGVGSQVLSIFRLVRMNRVFEIYPDVNEAVSSFSQPYPEHQAQQPTDEPSGESHEMGRSPEMIREI